MDSFDKAFHALNEQQKQAVRTIEGPVMVVAGPGTGKTQILALRIATILRETDAGAGGILCLTFTNAGVVAMKKRLRAYIGADAEKVKVKTFHSFAEELLETYFSVVGFSEKPTLMDDMDALMLFDELLEGHTWNYFRARSQKTNYLKDIKQTINILKRDRCTPSFLQEAVQKEIQTIKEDPESISSRGATKGMIKKTVLTTIQSLEKTYECAVFYEKYELLKKEKGLCDFNDILEFLVQMVELDDSVAASLREQFLYVLVDEHQDSSGVQNEFLSLVWGNQETQNIFVVGDDRQLIYGFGGASLSYFEGFLRTFPTAQCISLVHNYRSTQAILTLADTLLSSTMTSGVLQSNSTAPEVPVQLVSASYARDEIIAAGIFFKERIAQGIAPEECALLVPKNSDVRNAVSLLRDMNIPVTGNGTLDLFEQSAAQGLLRACKAIIAPYTQEILVDVLLDPISGIPPLEAQKFLAYSSKKDITLDTLLVSGGTIQVCAERIADAATYSASHTAYQSLQYIADVWMIQPLHSHEQLLLHIEIVRSFLHLAEQYAQKNRGGTLKEFIEYCEQFIEYKEKIPLAVLQGHHGVQVMTLHSSKGLEFDVVWIAHMTQKQLEGDRRERFKLPRILSEQLNAVDHQEHIRKVYVAITRAKKECVLSYHVLSYSGKEENLATCIEALPKELFTEQSAEETEARILTEQPLLYIAQAKHESSAVSVPEALSKDIQQLVADTYKTKRVSVTALNNFFTCPWTWYFRNFLTVPEPQTASLFLGTITHAVIQHIIQGSQESEEVLLDSVLSSARSTQTIVLSEQEKESIITSVAFFREHEYKTYTATLESEKGFDIKALHNSDLSLYGKIDLIHYHTPSLVTVTDFKTGKPKTSTEIEKRTKEGRLSSYMRQLAMYALLIHQKTKHTAHPVTVTSCELLFLESLDVENRCYKTTVSEEEIALLCADIETYDTMLSDGSWMMLPCAYVSKGGGDVCPYCTQIARYTSR